MSTLRLPQVKRLSTYLVTSVILLSCLLVPRFAQGVTHTSDTTDAELTARLANYRRVGAYIHDLVKLADDGIASTQMDSAVYYIGEDGKRHAFPNTNVFLSWYPGFANVRIMGATDLASIPLGMNVTYRPGVRLVKFLTEMNVYAVAGNSTLRWIKVESIAQELYGMNWRSNVEDINDTFYQDYSINLGNNIVNASDYSPSLMRSTYANPGEVMFP